MVKDSSKDLKRFKHSRKIKECSKNQVDIQNDSRWFKDLSKDSSKSSIQ